jgi:hypothetical protein
MMSEFKQFNKIPRLDSGYMEITQKIHGSNAQICIYEDENNVFQLYTACRIRIITPGDDNYGFAKFVYDNREEFINKLGVGTHFGEWAGPGINSGEGLKEKTFVLFNWRKFSNYELPRNTRVVPLLYNGRLSTETVEQVFENLKTNGSFLVPGYMKPEGIVVSISGHLYKKVFDPEEVAWTKCDTKIRVPRETIDVSHLLQPLRLEKLLSKDERYLVEYPSSLPKIASDYVADLIEENQIAGNDNEIKGMKKALGSQLYNFIKTSVQNRPT